MGKSLQFFFVTELNRRGVRLHHLQDLLLRKSAVPGEDRGAGGERDLKLLGDVAAAAAAGPRPRSAAAQRQVPHAVELSLAGAAAARAIAARRAAARAVPDGELRRSFEPGE